jgi:hypothetical protein
LHKYIDTHLERLPFMTDEIKKPSSTSADEPDVYLRFSALVKQCGGEGAAHKLLTQLTSGHAPDKSTINRMVGGQGRESSVAAFSALLESRIVKGKNARTNTGNVMSLIEAFARLSKDGVPATNVYVRVSGKDKRYSFCADNITLINGDIELLVSPENKK